MTAQQEMVKQLVSALDDAGRGRGAGLTNLLAEFSERAASRPSKEDHLRLKAAVHPVTLPFQTWQHLHLRDCVIARPTHAPASARLCSASRSTVAAISADVKVISSRQLYQRLNVATRHDDAIFK